MSYTIYVREGEKMIPFDSLSEEEKDKIRRHAFMGLADGIMEPDGYCRVKDACKKIENSI